MLGELLGVCVGDYAGPEAGQNAGTLVGCCAGVPAGGKLGVLGLDLARTLLPLEPLNEPGEPKIGKSEGATDGVSKGL